MRNNKSYDLRPQCRHAEPRDTLDPFFFQNLNKAGGRRTAESFRGDFDLCQMITRLIKIDSIDQYYPIPVELFLVY